MRATGRIHTLQGVGKAPTSGAGGDGGGDVIGPGAATANAVARFDGTSGKRIKGSAVTIDDAGNISTPGTVDGRDLSVDGAKLDGIDVGAQVTSTDRVAAAGAVMRSVVEGEGDLIIGTGAGEVGRLAHPGVAGKLARTTETGFEFVDPSGGGGGPELSDDPAKPLASASAGTSGEASRADHVHAHGNQAGGTLHALATTSTAGFMSAGDKAKVDAAIPGTAFQAAGDILIGTGNGTYTRLQHPGEAGKVLKTTETGFEFGDAGGAVALPYDIRTGFVETPKADEVLDTIVLPRGIVLPADLAGSVGAVGTNPTVAFELSILDDDVKIATVSISDAGAFSFSTVGNVEQPIAAGSVLTIVAPATPDATVENVAITLAGTVA